MAGEPGGGLEGRSAETRAGWGWGAPLRVRVRRSWRDGGDSRVNPGKVKEAEGKGGGEASACPRAAAF